MLYAGCCVSVCYLSTPWCFCCSFHDICNICPQILAACLLFEFGVFGSSVIQVQLRDFCIHF